MSTLVFSYGRHFPHGQSAVEYIYSNNGTFKALKNVIYNYNYYEQYATATHPYDKSALIEMSNGQVMTTCRDANGHLLLDYNHDGEIDITTDGSAFHEHNGQGINSQQMGNPFTNFWFDDNVLASHMSKAYSREEPHGLSDYTEFTRWRIMGGYDKYWNPYNEDYFDTLALDGLYYITKNEINLAISRWEKIVTKSGAIYHEDSGFYEYPNFTENYHVALFRVLTDKLILYYGSKLDVVKLTQHSQSIRVTILSNQQHGVSSTSEGSLIPTGWLSSMNSQTSLMNTESIALGVLSLSTSGDTYEIGVGPLVPNTDFQYNNGKYFLSLSQSLSSTSSSAIEVLNPTTSSPIAINHLGENNIYLKMSVVSRCKTVSDKTTYAKSTLTDANGNVIITCELTCAQAYNANSTSGAWNTNECVVPMSSLESLNTLWFQVYWYGLIEAELATVNFVTLDKI